MRLLVAEDDVSLGASIKQGLIGNHYAVDLVTNGADALEMARLTPYDLVILDVLLPGISGFEVCRRLRAAKRLLPILFLTALGAVEQRVRGLDLGGDDYLVKPFAFAELEARVRALLRRETEDRSAEMHFLDIVVDTRTHEVRRGGRQLELTSKQYALLAYLFSHPRQVISRTMIAEHVWDGEAEHFSNVIDVYIGALRRKLCESGEPDVIHTIRGAGYQLREPHS